MGLRLEPHAFRCFGDGAGYLRRLHRQRGDRFISESKALQLYDSALKACLLACRCRTKTLTRSYWALLIHVRAISGGMVLNDLSGRYFLSLTNRRPECPAATASAPHHAAVQKQIRDGNHITFPKSEVLKSLFSLVKCPSAYSQHAFPCRISKVPLT
jgi:hypothetical protein